jgi:uncharacterized protein (TIGR02118 family)
MVKLFALLPRKTDLTHDEFVEHWLGVHAPLIAGAPSLARHIVRYEQHVRHRPDALSGSLDFDGVTEQWFDSMDDFVAFMSEPAYGELIAPDEQRFLDMDRLEFIITEEPVIAIGADDE